MFLQPSIPRVRQDTEIRFSALRKRHFVDESLSQRLASFMQFPHHPFLRSRTDDAMVREVDKAEKVDTFADRTESHFVRVQGHRQSLFQKLAYQRQQSFEFLFVATQNDEIVVVPEILLAA